MNKYREALEAALRWMETKYKEDIYNDSKYIRMIEDKLVDDSYKDDITLIRRALNNETGEH